MSPMPDVSIIITLVIMVAAIAIFSIEILSVDIVSILVVLALILSHILTPREAFLGFSNTALIMIASIIIMSSGLIKTGIPNRIAHFILRWAGTHTVRLMLFFLVTVGVISSFINNVAATAILLPTAVSVANTAKINPSKLLMPLSFGSMLGGMCTLIGTSTNIAVSEALSTYNIKPFSIFEFTPIGIMVLLSGIVYFITLGRHLLPDRVAEPPIERYDIRTYLSELKIMPNSSLAGMKISEGDFGNLHDLTIVGLYREGKNIYIPGEHYTIREGDSLLVMGSMENLTKINNIKGVEIKSSLKTSEADLESGDVRIVEAVIAADSILDGKTLKAVNFRHTYGLSVIAMYRHGTCLREKIGKIPLRVGDVLLIQGEKERINTLKDMLKLIIAGDVTPERFRTDKARTAILIFLLAIGVGATGLLSLPVAFLAGAVSMVLTKCIYPDEIYKSLNWHLLILIGGMLSLGIAVEKSGTARYLSEHIIALASPYGHYAILACFFILTTILTQSMSNVAAALLILPIAIHTATNLGLNPKTFAITVALAASCSFITPLEPASVLVYGPGRYRFVDFIKVGLPLTLVAFIVAILFIPIFWPL